MNDRADKSKETDGKRALKESYRWLLTSGAITKEQYEKMIEMLNGKKSETSSQDEDER